jgi:TolB protein
MKNYVLFFLIFASHLTINAQSSIGLFENHTDIGAVLNKGNAVYNNAIRTYTLTGSGENIWFKKDELHLAWKKLKGDFIITTQTNFVGKGTDPHRKNGIMFRTSLDTSAAMVCLTVHGDGLTAFQYRKKNNTNIEEVKIPTINAEVLQLERRGRSYFISVAKLGSPFWTVEVPDFDFPEELFSGIFICSHNKNVVEEANFTNTRIYVGLK